MMPQMDGYELHENIRGTPQFSHIPFVFLSALSDSVQIRRGKEAGADDYLAKPFDPQELVAVVRGKVLRSKNLQQGSEQCYDSYRKKVIHTLSHEFRTPLVAINTGTDLLIERKGTIEESKVRHLLEAIQRGGRRLEQLVNDFMSLQQIEAGIAKRVHDAHANHQKVSDLLNTFRESNTEWLAEERFALSITDQSEGASVRVYAPQVLDILSRLTHNSVKFKLKILTIDLVAYRQLEEVFIEVRDRGIGMDPDRVREAVDVFGQIDRDKLEQQGGGLGLAIANRYAVLNGGRLEFESRKGGGAVVTLVLPQV
jgi:signal transduction histidine kinase